MEEEEEEGGDKLHIAMLPWLAMGHLRPFMELSKRIASNGHRISFLSTPSNLRRLIPAVPPHLAALIVPVDLPLQFVEHLPGNTMDLPSDDLPLQSVEHLPCNTMDLPSDDLPLQSVEHLPCNTMDLPSDDLRGRLKSSYDALAGKVAAFLHESRPDWLVVDYAAWWAPAAAGELGIPCAHLSLYSAAVYATWGPPEVLSGDEERTSPEQFTTAPPWVPFPSGIAFKPFEARAIFSPPGTVDDSGVSEGFRYRKTIEGSSFIAVRSCDEFEPRWIRLLSELHRKQVVPAGFFPCNDDDDPAGAVAGLFSWLDKREPRSVVYAAFGTEVKLSPEQVREIAHGLEGSGLPFVWAARSPESWLPEGFLHRTSSVVCFDWVPQARVLGHPAIAGFVTHCGWNSIVEALRHGVPLVMMPMVFDQGLNARDMAERGVGAEVPRGDDDGEFTGDGIARTVRLVVVEEEGERFREGARRSMEVFGDEELQDRCVRNFIKHLRCNRKSVLSASGS